MQHNVWCYWSQGKDNISYFASKCLENWRQYLSPYEFKINIIDKPMFLKIQNEIDTSFFEKLTFQQQSDLVRLFLLYEYGGIWLDITTILTDDLKWITKKFNEGYDQVGFYLEFPFHVKTPYLRENWCIAVKYPKN